MPQLLLALMRVVRRLQSIYAIFSLRFLVIKKCETPLSSISILLVLCISNQLFCHLRRKEPHPKATEICVQE